LKKLNAKRILPILLFLSFSGPTFALENYELPSGEWRLISLPLDPGGSRSVNDIFGDDINANYGTEWLMYGYDPVAKTYETKDLNGSLQYGVAYWILQITGESVQLDMPASSFESRVVPLMVPAEGETHQWNFVGYPLNIAKKFSDLKIKTSSGICAGEGCDPSEANLQKVFKDEVWRPSQNDSKQYEKVTGETVLKPWDGFWCVTLEEASKVAPVVLTAKASPLPPIAGNWTLSFADDFNGTTLDPNNWRLGAHFLGINGLAGNSAKHTIVRDGKLELIAEKKPLRFAGQDYEYSAGEITTFQKHRQLYGYFESRIKYDAVRGVWPAFWTMPDRGEYGNEDIRKQSYLRFDLNITQPVSRALLKVKVTGIENPGNKSNITFYKLLTNDWSEETINWEKKPDYDPAWLQQFTGTTGENNEIVVGQDLVIDVTEYVNNQIASSKSAGFAIADTFRQANAITLGSRESADANDRPRLEIEGTDIFPTADAYVNAGSDKNSNFGSAAELVIKDPWKNTSSVANKGMEIDVMESLGIWGDDKTQHALHWDYYGSGHPMTHSDGSPLTIEPTSDGYHVYGMYWEPGRITFYIDGKETWKYDNARVGSIASYILLSHQLGGWSGNANIDDAGFPATMYVDYVYTWEGTPG